MGITLASNFDVNAALPLDSRMIAADATARDAIIAGVRYEGMLVYVVADQTMYQLQGGITNGDWAAAGGGGGGSVPVVDLATGDGVLTAFTLSQDPGTEENVAVYLDGVRQSTAEYSIATTTLTFSVAPYNGATLMFVIGGVTVVNVPAANSVTTAKIADNAVTTAKILDANVTTAKIADNAITPAKRAALGQQVSSSSGSYSLTGTTSITDVTNLSITITTTGRPVFVGLISDGTGVQSTIVYTDTQVQLSPELYFYRGATNISAQSFAQRVGGSSVYSFTGVPVSAVSHIDIPSAGTYTYKFSVRPTASTAVMEVLNAKLIAYEL